jgi:hypothetical protein
MFASYKKLYTGMLGSTQLGMRPEQEQPNHACSVVLEKKMDLERVSRAVLKK